MKIGFMILREIRYRKVNFLLSSLAAATAAAALLITLLSLRVHDVNTERLLTQKEEEFEKRGFRLKDDYRVMMKDLGHDILILSKSQDLGEFFDKDYASSSFPESYLDTLAKALTSQKQVWIRHLVPSLRLRVWWPEINHHVMAVGLCGEVAIDSGSALKEDMIEPVKPGQVIVGSEISRFLGIDKGGQAMRFREEMFMVQRAHAPRGTRDDLTIWLNLADAQRLFGRKGEINAILALQCMCTGNNVETIRGFLERALPQTQVLRQEQAADTRFAARKRADQEARESLQSILSQRARLKKQHERFASVLSIAILLCCAAWIAYLSFYNTRDRKHETGILLALGFSRRRIMWLFLGRALLIGMTGGFAGYVLGAATGALLYGGVGMIMHEAFNPLLFSILPGICLLTVLSAWLAALSAALRDPALILNGE